MKNRCLNIKWIRVPFIWIVVSFISLYTTTLFAGQVTLAWDAADNPSLSGYHLYKRLENQGYDYNSPAWSGTATTCTIDQLSENTYYFVARAFDGDNESVNSNEVEFKVVVNQAPVADAGTDQAVSAGIQVTLDGSGSIDSDGSISQYKWTQTAGPMVSLSSLTSRQITFTAPDVAESTNLSFQLAVTDDGGLTNSDACQVTVLPVAPVDSDGDGVNDGQEVADNSEPNVNTVTDQNVGLWLEAEDAEVSVPMIIHSDSEASASMAIGVPNGVGSFGSPSSQAGYAEFSFDIEASGDYFIWGRVLAPSGKDDSFFVAVDNDEFIRWNTQQSIEWIWDKVWSNSIDPIVYSLQPGVHTLYILHREDGALLDRILITGNRDYIPEGTGPQFELEAVTHVEIEAETGIISAPFQVLNDTTASGGKYLCAPNGVGSFSNVSESAGIAEFPFVVTEEGDYLVWGLVRSPSGKDDSFFISMDDSNFIRWNTELGTHWGWDQAADSNTAEALVYHLSPGAHRLYLLQREDGTCIDQLVVTKNLDYIPE
jgi:hypothetical protein